MDSHRIWWLFLWLCPFFLRFGHSISEFEVDPEILCGEGCKAIENGDFNEFWCVYKARSSKDFVYAGICGTGNQSDIKKLEVSATVLKTPSEENFPVRLIPFTEQSAFTTHFAYVTEDKAWFTRDLISEVCNPNSFDFHPGGFVAGTDFHRSKTTGYDSADVCGFVPLAMSRFEKFKYGQCFEEKISCATDMDTLELVSIPGRAQSVYTRAGLFVYLKCTKAICRTMIQDILANTTYYIPTDLTVSQEPLTDFQEFLYLVPRIYTNETIFEEQRRYKHAMITTYEACDTYLLKPTNSTVKVSQCGTFYILLFVLIAMGVLSVALPVAVKLFFCIRNCRRLRGAYKQPQAISPVTPRVYRPEPSKVQVVEAKEGDKQSDKQYESVQGTASGVTEQQQQVTNLDSVPLAGPTGTEKKEEK